MQEFQFDAYFETSAKEGWRIEELKVAILNSISWERLPKTTSTSLFQSIKELFMAGEECGSCSVKIDRSLSVVSCAARSRRH